MEQLIKRLTRAGTVGIGTPIFIYHVEANDRRLFALQSLTDIIVLDDSARS